MTKLVLDTNIWNKLDLDAEARERMRHLCESGKLEIIVPDTVEQELAGSPFRGIRDWFPVSDIPDSVFILDHSRLDHARLGEGKMFTAHRGKKKRVKDSVIVDTADTDADVFVSEDRRARRQYAKLRSDGRAMDYARLRTEILGL